MSIVVYDPATGTPKRLHTGPYKALERAKARIAEGEAYIEGDYHSIAGKRVVDKQLVDVERTREDAMRELRKRRDRLLKSTDWTQVSDAPVDQRAWADYRQALRDLPNTADPFNPTFPDKPRS